MCWNVAYNIHYVSIQGCSRCRAHLSDAYITAPCHKLSQFIVLLKQPTEPKNLAASEYPTWPMISLDSSHHQQIQQTHEDGGGCWFFFFLWGSGNLSWAEKFVFKCIFKNLADEIFCCNKMLNTMQIQVLTQCPETTTSVATGRYINILNGIELNWSWIQNINVFCCFFLFTWKVFFNKEFFVITWKRQLKLCDIKRITRATGSKWSRKHT